MIIIYDINLSESAAGECKIRKYNGNTYSRRKDNLTLGKIISGISQDVFVPKMNVKKKQKVLAALQILLYVMYEEMFLFVMKERQK